eukprot:TRINITY_DN13725_c0_g1_i1.p1 TRINITY_DN13725_c0_g1~~TRINITY_DN13725_c0_g1_i1.p1  ORF type:complete len:261 (-),score=44.38 TRINITY_DN13725_c0_g1_i1:37-819(-)
MFVVPPPENIVSSPYCHHPHRPQSPPLFSSPLLKFTPPSPILPTSTVASHGHPQRIPRADHSPQNIGFKPFYHLVCGSSAGCVATIFTYPLDMIRARMASQVHRNVYRNSWHGLTVMKREEGYRSWFKGMRTTIQGIIPYAGVNFSTFETLKFFAPKNENGDLPTFWKLVCGGIAGPVGQTVSYPWDLVRRRQQTWGFAPGTEDVGKIGTCASFRKIVRMEGFFGLWRGISINYLKATPTVAIAFTVYETIQSNLQFVLL